MAESSDPTIQIGYLQQCFSQDKRPLGLLLGAGCPMAVKSPDGAGKPLIPDIEGITKATCAILESNDKDKALIGAVHKHFEQDGVLDPNIEAILSHVRSLRVVAGKEKVRGLLKDELDTLDADICTAIHTIVDKKLPDSGTPYHKVAQWVDATSREFPVEIFTTNYDLLMEQAMEDSRVPYFDGFAGSRKPFFDLRAMEEDVLPPRWARLWKLHGSINWYQTAAGSILRGSTTEVGLRRVIHPSHLKYEESRRMPYLAMLDRLRDFLRKPNAALVICGYSFRDEHINEILIQGLRGTQTAIAFGLLFSDLEKYEAATALATDRRNLTLIANDGAIISGHRHKWHSKSDDAIKDQHQWVVWTPIAEGDPKSLKRASVTLGDFSELGAFLAALAGKGA
jgi:hypothetical protein